MRVPNYVELCHYFINQINYEFRVVDSTGVRWSLLYKQQNLTRQLSKTLDSELNKKSLTSFWVQLK